MATNRETIYIPLEDVESEHCALIVEKGLAQVKGVETHKVELNNRRAAITVNDNEVVGEAVKAIKDLGYGVPTVKKTYPVLGMTCASCAGSAESMAKYTPGVVNAEVNYGTGNLNVEFLPNITSSEQIRKAVQDGGYDLLLEDENKQQETLEAIHAEKFRKLKNKTIGLIRLDSGFFQSDILDYLEEKLMNYVVAVKFSQPIQSLIHASENWIILDAGIEICEQIYQSDSWQKPRRIVVVRQKLKDRPKAPGKQLLLFAEEEIYRNYRYSAYVSNLNLPAAEIWRLYRGRGDAENRIKELKYDFGFDSFNLNDFFATEAALTFAMIAYNLMSLFRMFVLQEKTQKTLSTLRYRTFAIGAYFEKVNDRLVLKIALNKKRRAWFSGLWNFTHEFKFPFYLANA